MWPLVRAVVDPAPPVHRMSWWRYGLLAPRLFDVVSCLWQRKEAWRMPLIANGQTDAHRYNAGVTLSKPWVRTRRAESIYQLLTLPPAMPATERLLIVGPRTVQELYLAWLYGYRWLNICAIDLYSLHPKIEVMDMERITFPDRSFHAIALSNTLAYATDLRACLAGLARVLAFGGRMAFETIYAPEDTRWPSHTITSRQVREWLGELKLAIRHESPVEKTSQRGVWQRTTTFLVQREPPAWSV